jgi:ketosteroid isomerase-like protein
MPDTQAQSTRSVVEAAYAAAIAGDAGAITALLHPDVVLHEAASLSNGGVHRGLAAVMQALGAVFATFDLSRLQIERIVTEGEFGIGLVRIPLRGCVEAMPVAEVYRVQAGRIMEIRPFYWDTAMLAAPPAGAD